RALLSLRKRYTQSLIHAATTLASFLLLWTLRQRVCSMDQRRLPCRKDARSPAVCMRRLGARSLAALSTLGPPTAAAYVYVSRDVKPPSGLEFHCLKRCTVGKSR